MKDYLRIVQPGIKQPVDFSDRAYGWSRGDSRDLEAVPLRDFLPHRWGFLSQGDDDSGVENDDESNLIFIGEYKPPTELKTETLHRVLSAGPGDEFFPEAIRAKQAEEQKSAAALVTEADDGPDGASTPKMPDHVLDAQMPCQAYHHIISSGYERRLQNAGVREAHETEYGRLVLVFLGVNALERPISLRGCIEVSHMLLLSYAGPNLCSPARPLPQDVDLEAETDRSTRELELAGVYNDAIRSPNLAWNAEVRRVMHFDFDQA